MHKKTKFDQPRQQRRVRALDRFQEKNIHGHAEYIRRTDRNKTGEADAAAYIARRMAERANLAARVAGSSA